MANLVDEVLQRDENNSAYKTIKVSKAIQPTIDAGNLLISDPNSITLTSYREDTESYIKDLTRENTQLLFNRLWNYPIKKEEGVICAWLPKGQTILPREKVLPAPKPMTKWEEYAKAKGIVKRKKDTQEWDEEHQEWRRTYGYKRANDKSQQWLVEVPQHADHMENQFTALKRDKKERAAKNELKRLRNIARNSKNAKGVGVTPVNKPDNFQLVQQAIVSRRSTASMGKFTQTLAKEKQVVKRTEKRGNKYSNTENFGTERARHLDILHKLHKEKPVLNMAKLTKQEMHIQNTTAKPNKERPIGKTKNKKTSGGKKMGGQKYAKGGKRMRK